MIFYTSELRWFADDNIPLLKVYESITCDNEMNTERRTDYYARDTGQSTGIKMRAGLFEGKFKTGPDSAYPEAYGNIERWVKWSSSDKFLDLEEIKFTVKKDWLAVKKERRMKRFELKENNRFECINSMEISRGCAVEYTEIKIGESDRPVYTFCLEAFGEKDSTDEILKNCLEFLKPDLKELKNLRSCGYPEYLGII